MHTLHGNQKGNHWPITLYNSYQSNRGHEQLSLHIIGSVHKRTHKAMISSLAHVRIADLFLAFNLNLRLQKPREPKFTWTENAKR